MTAHRLQKKSAAHKVICKLVDLGGTASIERLVCDLAPEYQRPHMRDERVMGPLLEKGYIKYVDELIIQASALGKDYVGGCLNRPALVPEKYVGILAAPRVRVPDPVLNFNKIYPTGVYRDGAFDHRNIPSRMGNLRVLPNGEVVE